MFSHFDIDDQVQSVLGTVSWAPAPIHGRMPASRRDEPERSEPGGLGQQ